jgi:hypothetical protein
MHHDAYQPLHLLLLKRPPLLSQIQLAPTKDTGSEICTSVPETMACHNQGLCNSACTMTDANAIPDGIVGASVVTALFLFIAMLDTEALGLDVVGTLWIFALSLFVMQVTIPITMFHGFPFASFMYTYQFIHDAVLCFEDVSCDCVRRMWVVAWWVQNTSQNDDVCS